MIAAAHPGHHERHHDRASYGHDQEPWACANSAEALADAIEGASTKKLSILGESAARAAENLYSWSRVFEELFCIYRETCANYRRS